MTTPPNGVTGFGYAPFAADPQSGQTVYQWTCDGCDDTDIMLGEAGVIQAGNRHLSRRHLPTAAYNTGVDGWWLPPPDWPPPPVATEGVTAQPWYEVAAVEDGVPVAFLWRCNLDWGWGVADSEDGALRRIEKHVRHYHRE
jgi:hypothetical protein